MLEYYYLMLQRTTYKWRAPDPDTWNVDSVESVQDRSIRAGLWASESVTVPRNQVKVIMQGDRLGDNWSDTTQKYLDVSKYLGLWLVVFRITVWVYWCWLILLNNHGWSGWYSAHYCRIEHRGSWGEPCIRRNDCLYHCGQIFSMVRTIYLYMC